MQVSTSSLTSLLTVLLSAGCASRSFPVEVPRDSAASRLASEGQLYDPGELALTSWNAPSAGTRNVPASTGRPSESEAQHQHQHRTGHSEASRQAAAAEEDQAAGDQYQCPMHPEVVSDQPGDCPICGMTLEKQETKR